MGYPALIERNDIRRTKFQFSIQTVPFILIEILQVVRTADNHTSIVEQ